MYTKLIVERVNITELEARSLVVEARVFRDPDELIAYRSDGRGMLIKSYVLPIPVNVESMDNDKLLEHARDNMPKSLHFGLG